MKTNDPAFRSVIANLEKASNGQALRDALAKYEPDWMKKYSGIEEDSASRSGSDLRTFDMSYSGVLPYLEWSHFNRMSGTDPEWFIPPEGGPGIRIIDFDPKYDRIDQDGNPI